jgi:hypothetical protein
MGLARILLVASPESTEDILRGMARGGSLRGLDNPLWAISDGVIVAMFSYAEEINPVEVAQKISLGLPDAWMKVDFVGDDFSLSSHILTPTISEEETPRVEIEISADANLENIGEVASSIKDYFGKEWFYEKENWSKLEEYEFDGIRLSRHPINDTDGDAGSPGEDYEWLEQPKQDQKND